MDCNTYQASYGYQPPQSGFSRGARAGIIVASSLSILVSVVQLLLLAHMNSLYFVTNTLYPTNFTPIVSALLMIVMGAVAKPTRKKILAIPVSLWAASSILACVFTLWSYFEIGFGVWELLRLVLPAIPLYTLVVVLLMWLTCGGAIKNGIIGGIIISSTSVLGCMFAALIYLVEYSSDYGFIEGAAGMLHTANLISNIAAMLFFVANAVALFMIGTKPKMPQYGYAPTAYPTQGTTPQSASPTAPLAQGSPVSNAENGSPIYRGAGTPQSGVTEGSEEQPTDNNNSEV